MLKQLKELGYCSVQFGSFISVGHKKNTEIIKNLDGKIDELEGSTNRNHHMVKKSSKHICKRLHKISKKGL